MTDETKQVAGIILTCLQDARAEHLFPILVKLVSDFGVTAWLGKHIYKELCEHPLKDADALFELAQAEHERGK